MNSTSTTQGRHALRWVLGVGLVFMVVVGMALQVARSRADERWLAVMSHWEKEWPPLGLVTSRKTKIFARRQVLLRDTRGGNLLRAWRQSEWESPWFVLVLRQERSLFGNRITARMSGATSGREGAVRDVLAPVDVVLVVDSQR